MKGILIVGVICAGIYIGNHAIKHSDWGKPKAECPACHGHKVLFPDCTEEEQNGPALAERTLFCTTPRRCEHCAGEGQVAQRQLRRIPRGRLIVLYGKHGGILSAE